MKAQTIGILVAIHGVTSLLVAANFFVSSLIALFGIMQVVLGVGLILTGIAEDRK